MLNFYTRGGQLALHKLHMFKQICLTTLLAAFCVGLCVFAILFFSKTTSYQRCLYKEHLYAEFMVNMSQNDPSRITQEFSCSRKANGALREVKSQDILKNRHIQRHIVYIDHLSSQNMKMSLWGVFVSFVILMGFFGYSGYLKSKKKLERGAQMVSARSLRRLLRKTNEASDLHLDKLPLVKDKETAHILMTGTTSAGKTNCFHTLLPQIQSRPNRAIVVDMTGDFVSKYYREGTDLILNPFDQRTEHWSPWAECLTETHYDALAAAIIPETESPEKFWENAAKVLFSTALKEGAGERNIQKLYHILVRSNLKDFEKFFQETDAATYTNSEGEKMTLSIRACLVNHLQGLKYLKQTSKPFSFRDWVKNEDTTHGQWIFLTANPDQRKTLIPLISAWLDTAINALMTLPRDYDRRLWFIIDELPSLQELPSLKTALAEARKYGGCLLAGVQNSPQLFDTYGYYQAQSILDLFNTKIFFRNTDPQTAQWISKALGEAEITEQIENLSYGAHNIRDGVSLSPHTRIHSLILPTEVASLENFEAFIKLPGAYPACKIKMTYKNMPTIAVDFKPTPETQPNGNGLKRFVTV
ncbi:MAG TPA: type IV secretion system DNA-binding domain-containing protein [Alphaproteobacteria bacterium]|nr:type IV secretion system DNA-binding domain-containing protein [Alphaproteobacteria bacterium]